MSQNPYGAPVSASAEVIPTTSLVGRILAPLLMPMVLIPVALGVGSILWMRLPLSATGGAILNFLPAALIFLLWFSPLVMLVLLPFGRMPWLKRGLLASAINAVLMVAGAWMLGVYFSQPVEVTLPARQD